MEANIDSSNLSVSKGDNKSPQLYAVSIRARHNILLRDATIHGEPQSAILMLQNEVFEVTVILFFSNLLDSFLSTDPKRFEYECRIGNTMYPILPLTDSKVEVVSLGPKERAFQLSLEHSLPLEPIITYTRVVAMILGIAHIYIHPSIDIQYHEVFPEHEGELHIFLGMTPAQSSGYTHPKEIFGVSVCAPSGRFYQLHKPLFGRGVVLSDGEQDVIQIIESNYYFLYDVTHLIEIESEGYALYKKMFEAMIDFWNGNTSRVVDQAPYMPIGKNEIDALVEQYHDMSVQMGKNKLEILALEVSILENDLRQKRKILAESLLLFKGMCDADVLGKTLTENLMADFPRIQAHKLMREARIIPGVGIEVRTKDVVMEHDGVHHALGRYVISIGVFGDIVIWTEHTMHPRGVPHPHISAWNGPCFGNLGETIDDAVAEYRHADAFEYILDWLADGYAPDLIVFEKIDEWPIVTEPLTRGEHV